MKAHIIENGLVVNTIEVDSLEFMPGLVPADEGMIGDSYDNGIFSNENAAEEIVKVVPEKVTMRQAKLALLQNNLLTSVNDTINNGTDEVAKIEWEYSTEIERNWPSLISITESLGLTSSQVDDLFILAQTL